MLLSILVLCIASIVSASGSYPPAVHFSVASSVTAGPCTLLKRTVSEFKLFKYVVCGTYDSGCMISEMVGRQWACVSRVGLDISIVMNGNVGQLPTVMALTTDVFMGEACSAETEVAAVTMYYNVSAANDITKSVNLFSHSVYLKATQMTATTYNCTTPLVTRSGVQPS